MHTPLRMTATALSALAVLITAACGSGDDPATGTTGSGAQTPGGTESTAPTGTGATTDDDDDDGTTDDDSDDTSDDGTTDDDDDDSDDTSDDDSDTDDDSDDDPDAGADLATVTSVISAAEKEADGTAYEVGDQDGDGSFEVDVAKGGSSIEVAVADDGSIMRTDDPEPLDADDKAALAKAEVSLAEAMESALGEIDGTIDSAEIDTTLEGETAWAVTVRTPREDVDVYVDIKTGKVLEVGRG